MVIKNHESKAEMVERRTEADESSIGQTQKWANTDVVPKRQNEQSNPLFSQHIDFSLQPDIVRWEDRLSNDLIYRAALDACQ